MTATQSRDDAPKSAFESYVESRGLRSVVVGGHLDEYTPMMSIGPAGARADGATGPILDDLPATLLHSTYAETTGESHRGRDFTLIVAAISEAVAFARNLSCRDRKVQDDLDHTALARFGDSREVELESVEFDRRYALQAPPEIGAGWLRQLFTPTLIEWLAASAPPGFCFELNEGHFCAAIPGHVDDAATLDAFSTGAKRVAGRIRDEALEGAGHASEAVHAEADKRFERLLRSVRFDEPPPDVGAAADRYMPVALRRPGNAFRAIGASLGHLPSASALIVIVVVAALFATGQAATSDAGTWLVPAIIAVVVVLAINIRRLARQLAAQLGEEAFVREYAQARGLRVVDPGAFQAQHARLRLPGAVRHAMTGRLPGTQLDGTIALVDAGVQKQAELATSAGEAVRGNFMTMFGLGGDDDRTFDALVFEAPGAGALDAGALTSAAATEAAMSTAQIYAGQKPGEMLPTAQMLSVAMQAWQGLRQRVIGDGDTLALVRASSRRGRNLAELDALSAEAAKVAQEAAARASR